MFVIKQNHVGAGSCVITESHREDGGWGLLRKEGNVIFFKKVLVFYSCLIGGWQGPSVAFKINTDLAFLVFKTEFGRKNGSQAGIWGLLSNSFLDLWCQSLSN